jgi:acetate kinase
MDQRLCVLNAGSSSLKFAVYGVADGQPRLTQSGEVERIGGEGRLLITTADGKPLHDRMVTTKDHAGALSMLAALPDGPMEKNGLIGFGHRVVHGGPDLDVPVLVDAATLARIEALEPLAPLHNPPAVAVLKALAVLLPTLPHVACFDTAFHRGHPAVADRFAIPDALYRAGVRRYGFHGLSYEFIAGALAERVPEIALGRVVVAHLGSGASMCALAGGRSVESTMGFTALDGLPMGTRPGSLDAGVILWLQQQKGWDVDRVERFLYADCGLKGLSGISNDMRTLLASEAPLAKLAVEYFVYHVARTAGAMAAVMGGIDGLVFTAGIGERSSDIRSRVLHRLHWLGFSIDEAANLAGGPLLTRSESVLPAYAIPTDEEIVIARHTLDLIGRK